MGDPVDIHNLLQTGYFTTSRHKSKERCNPSELSKDLRFVLQPDQSTPQSVGNTRPSKRPPPPSVEDEDIVLKREHGTSKTRVVGEEPSSRGDIDQNPLIMEVHEYNPERRFVILNDDPDETNTPPVKPESDNRQKFEQPVSKFDETAPKLGTREESEPQEGNNRRHRRTPSEGLYVANSVRRRSRQDLPVIYTDVDENRTPQHHRSKSAASGPRPDFFSPRSSRQFGDQMLSPDVIKQEGGRREQRYYGYGESPRRDNQSRDRHREGRTRSPPESVGKLSYSSFDSKSPRRPISIDRGSDRRNQEFYHGSSYDDSYVKRYERSGHSSSKSSAKVSREHSRSNDEYSRSPRGSSNVKKPLETGRDTNVNLQKDVTPEEGVDKHLPSRTQTLPTAKANDASRSATDGFSALRPAKTFSVNDREDTSKQTALPHPEDDFFYIDPLDLPEPNRRTGDNKVANIKTEPAHISDIDVQATKSDASFKEMSANTSDAKAWKPPSFDPERDGTRLERPVGAFRRYSESVDEDGAQRLPECLRTTPIAGKTDWLTLPRTDFNICPACYGAVFSKSEHRTEFQPVLRPTVDAISCDFGSSPWYRIAWLLIMKNRDENLRMFRQIASVANASQGQRCPGQRKTTRDWYTVRDPYTRRPVPDFTVCYQCAKTVEVLLPSLSGVFVPQDPKSEAIRSVCALHFTPNRKAFVLYFDSFETVAEKAAKTKKSPDMGILAENLERLSLHNECREDRPITEGYWHFMQFIPEFTVCGDCFEDVVRPRLGDENVIARNFYIKPQRVPRAACQLYSSRMREVFKRACRRNDPKYLEAKVRERMAIEANIKAKLAKLDKGAQKDAWADKQIDILIEEWKEWE